MKSILSHPIIAGVGMVTLLYLIWIIMSGIGLRGVTKDESIKDIRQEAGLSLLGLTLLSLLILAVYFFLLKAPTVAPLPS